MDIFAIITFGFVLACYAVLLLPMRPTFYHFSTALFGFVLFCVGMYTHSDTKVVLSIAFYAVTMLTLPKQVQIRTDIVELAKLFLQSKEQEENKSGNESDTNS